MTNIVGPSSLVESHLPNYVVENYGKFVSFMKDVAESSERIGFGQHLISNLTKYRDFSNYRDRIVSSTTLEANLYDFDVNPILITWGELRQISNPNSSYFWKLTSVEVNDQVNVSPELREFPPNSPVGEAAENDILVRNRENTEYVNIGSYETQIVQITNGFGFPEKNGIILIDDEVILYRTRKGNTLSGIVRGGSAYTELSTFTTPGKYLNSEITSHSSGALVFNLSTLFLVSILDNIHDSFTAGISRSRVNEKVNHSLLICNIIDFFQSKGTKLGIQALFKMIFGDSNVDVSYPGDLMIVPSESTWAKDLLCTSVPVARQFYDKNEIVGSPGKLTGSTIQLKSYSDNQIYATCGIEYVNIYTGENTNIFGMVIADDAFSGNFIPNPVTKLNRDLEIGSKTITVKSTLGFPQSGLIFINGECIEYSSKSINQFYNCRRGKMGQTDFHLIGNDVYGPYYLYGTYLEKDKNGNVKTYTSRSWPLGLVNSVEVQDGGVLHTKDDIVTVQSPGDADYKSTVLNSYRNKENTTDALVEIIGSNIAEENKKYTSGVTRVFFDDDIVYVASNNLPNHLIGPFTNIMTSMKAFNAIHLIPKKLKENNNLITSKGTDEIGVAVNGVPFFSNILTSSQGYNGVIQKFVVKESGEGYAPVIIKNGIQTSGPVVVINPSKEAKAVPTVEGGKITAVTLTMPSSSTFTSIPQVTISSGTITRFDLSFDQFGRITAATAVGSTNYLNVPKIIVVDKTGRGRGAVLECTVNNGEITSVIIKNPGIDYFANQTYATTLPIGQGAVVEAKINEYNPNLPELLKNNPNYSVDSGNGYLFRDGNNVDSRYGYMMDPILLRKELQDNGFKHSPIIGWAYDGNPIYGPFGYANGINGALKPQTSSYSLITSRQLKISPSLSDYKLLKDASNKYFARSSQNTYPIMNGSQIYAGPYAEWETIAAAQVNGINIVLWKNIPWNHYHFWILNEYWQYQYSTGWWPSSSIETFTLEMYFSMDLNGDGIIGQPGITTPTNTMGHFVEDYEYLQGKGDLDEFNGKICNTPEFPASEYPNGVYCYFISIDNTYTPTFPYIIGPTFKNLPIVQDLNRLGYSQKEIYKPFAYGNKNNEFDFNSLQRNKINGIGSVDNSRIEVNITEISSGSLSNIVIQDSQNIDAVVGDFVSFDNSNTFGGGSQAKVSFVDGICIDTIKTCIIETRLISHRQRFDFRSSPNAESLFFIVNSMITASGANRPDATAKVESWDSNTKILIVRTQTINLIQSGQTIVDSIGNRVLVFGGTPITLNQPILTSAQASLTRSRNSQNLNLVSFQSPVERYDRTSLQEGDLWWSLETGKLYVYYTDINSSQWVVAQPYGVTPLGQFASNISTGVTGSSFIATPGGAPPSQSTITISDTAPTSSNIRLGDMWWSPASGILYIWNSDTSGYLNCSCEDKQVVNISTQEWVCTDPSGSVPTVGASNAPRSIGPQSKSVSPFVASTVVNVRISDSAPTTAVNGNMWWSSLTGKLYVYYINSWVVTNPIGSTRPSLYPSDIGGVVTQGSIINSTSILPEMKTENKLFFERIYDFYIGDKVSFNTVAQDVEVSTIIEKNSNKRGDALYLQRSGTSIDLPNNTLLRNESRFKMTFKTKTPHRLLIGDLIQLKTSNSELSNKFYEVIDAGYLDVAKGTVVVRPDKSIDSVNITYAGNNYRDNFYVTFIDGSGSGASGLAKVSNGKVISVEIIDRGQGYSSGTTVDFNSDCIWTMFSIYVNKYFSNPDIIGYITSSTTAIGPPAEFHLLSGGLGYTSLPKVRGIYKKEIDRAEVSFTMSGTSILSISVVSNRRGRRYKNPLVYIWDKSGTGKEATATATATNGSITSITVTNGGIDYDSPDLLIYEVGKFLLETNNIGCIQSFGMIKPGMNISNDNSLIPIIDVETKLILKNPVVDKCYPAPPPRNDWNNVQMVYQGSNSNKIVTANVVGWDSERQILIVKNIIGKFEEGVEIKDFDNLRSAIVLLSGQSKQKALIKGYSNPIGSFITDKSFVGSPLSYIQDSYRYQLFSYAIESAIPKYQYSTFVNEIIHPAGFIYFSDLLLGENITTTCFVESFDVEEYKTKYSNNR